MKKLNTIQKKENLNDVYTLDEIGPGGAHHEYLICKAGTKCVDEGTDGEIDVHVQCDEEPAFLQFQKGARGAEGSVNGLADQELLEVVRDRLKGFQSGPFACRENALALTKIEEALMWLNMRTEDRIARGVLGKEEK